MVGQTGSLVKGMSQAGKFDRDGTREMARIAHSVGVKFKETNGAYSSDEELRERRQAGVNAINVGPELGVAQTRVVISLARRYGLHRQLQAFLGRSLDSGKWKKWLHDGTSEAEHPIMAGHHCFASGEYHDLAEAIQRETDLGAAIRAKLSGVMDRYCRAMTDVVEG